MLLIFIVFVVVQILLESLPISSSGHVLLFAKIFSYYQQIPITISEPVEHLMNGPTIIVLLLYFYKDIFFVFSHWRSYWRTLYYYFFLLVLANSITTVIYFLFHVPILYYYKTVFPLWLGFPITALCLLSLKFLPRQKSHNLSFFSAALIGCVQGLALLPGISRLASTYTAARWLSISHYEAFRFTCALQAALFAGGFVKGLIPFIYNYFYFGELPEISFVLFGTILCACSGAYFLLWFVETLMRKNKLWYLGFYMFIPLAISFLF